MIPVTDLTFQHGSPGEVPISCCEPSIDLLVSIDDGRQINLPSTDLRLQLRGNPDIPSQLSSGHSQFHEL